MTSDEKRLAEALYRNVTFVPGSFDKRFAADLYAMSIGGRELTPRQRRCLLQQVHRYHKQLDQNIVKLAKAMQDGDFLEKELLERQHGRLGTLNMGTCGNHISPLGLPG